MKDFNKNRFMNFAKYDLTVNGKFYMTNALVSVVAITAINVLMYLNNYMTWKGVLRMTGLESLPAEMYWPDNVKSGATATLFIFAIIMMVFIGCWNHNLRTKQSRIFELTMPATNAEKFAWHIGSATLGGIATCLAACLLADAVQALLVYTTMQHEYVGSITAQIWQWASEDYSAAGHGGELDGSEFYIGFALLLVMYVIMQYVLYMFGGAVKYRLNILWTFIALQLIGFVLIICAVMVGSTFAMYANENMAMADTKVVLRTLLWGGVALETILTTVFACWTYKLYTKAQITSKTQQINEIQRPKGNIPADSRVAVR